MNAFSRRIGRGLLETAYALLTLCALTMFLIGPIMIGVPELYFIHLAGFFAALVWEVGT